MNTSISPTSAKKHISTLEALRLLDSLVRESEIGQAYADNNSSTIVADAINRAERRNARKQLAPHRDQISMHLTAALDAMKASDPQIASFIANIEETMRPLRV